MTERPYTDEDLRAEAAKQHKTLTEDIEFMCIGEQMQGSEPWESLGEDDFDTAQRAIDDLLTSAADVSEWAINLGADGLEADDRIVTAGDNKVRVHFAFAAEISEDDRADIVSQFAAFVIAGLH